MGYGTFYLYIRVREGSQKGQEKEQKERETQGGERLAAREKK